MRNNSFAFKEFTIHQDRCAMKVTTDACLFGAWVVEKLQSPKRILDIGAGTGLLSLMLAQASHGTIDAVEIEEQAYIQMKENIENSSFIKDIHPIHADIKNHTPDESYDLIISNPPFHQEQLLAESKKINLARHQEGLLFFDLILISKKWISQNGSIFILMPFYREKECSEMITESGGYIRHKALMRHSEKHNPFRVMFEIVFDPANTIEEEFVIHQLNGNHTQRFIELLQPYYLYL